MQKSSILLVMIIPSMIIQRELLCINVLPTRNPKIESKLKRNNFARQLQKTVKLINSAIQNTVEFWGSN